MFDLIRLKVCGFRGFVHEQEFVFNCPVVLLCGENHQGKSSTLNAIEWCFFGNECVGKKTGIRERIGWEIPNRQLPAEGMVVSVEFKGQDGNYRLTRERARGGRQSSETVTMCLPDGTELHGDEAERSAYMLFHSSFQDFMATVYQHQEAIRAVLTLEPRERNDAIDRLLGLSQYREILKGITAAKIEGTQKAMESTFEGFRKSREQGISTLDNLIRDEKAKAVTEGVTEEGTTEKEALSSAQGIREEVNALASELGTADLPVNTPQRLEEIGQFRESIKRQMDDLWAKAPDVVKQEALAGKQQGLSRLKGQFDIARADELTAGQERASFIDRYGEDEVLDRGIYEQQTHLKELDKLIRKNNTRANLVKEAIQYLKEAVPDIDSGRCPLCGTEKPQLLSHLETEWEDKIKAEVQELEAEKKQCQTTFDQLSSLKYQLGKLEGNLTTARSAYQSCVSQIATKLGHEIKEKDDPLALLTTRIQEIATELESIGDSIAKKRSKISDIYDQLTKLRIINEILDHEQRRSAIEHIWETSECAELENLRDEASQLVEDIRTIRGTIATASREEAESKIRSAEAALDKYFCCIDPHPGIPGLVMEVTEDRTGLNSYTFKSKDGSDPQSIMSQGDLNCLALAIFLGLAEATTDAQSFAFLMLDDPTQSLGSEMKRELVNVLNIIAEQRKLIIATPEVEFKDLLMSNITKAKVVYNFTDWTEKNGPQVSRSA